MRILLFMLAIFAVTAGIGTPAQAQNYPWCADYAGFGSQGAGFTTIQQCQAALSGNGGFCNANTQYVSPAPPCRERATTSDRRAGHAVPQHQEIAMRILLLLLAIFAVTPGSAQMRRRKIIRGARSTAAWAAPIAGSRPFNRCMATLAGMGGFCNANTQYVPPAGPSAPRARRQW